MKKLILLTIINIGILAHPAHSQTTAFNYQGSLQNNGVAANGTYDFAFQLFDALTGGNQLDITRARNGVVVTNGVFSVSLDFGNQFTGADRFLQILVRPTGGGSYTTLNPRHQIASSPYSVKTLSADVATNANNLNNQPASFYQNAANLNAGTVPDARIGSNFARRDVSNTFTGQNFFTSAANEFRGDGANLTNLNAANVSFGVLADGRLSSNIPRLNAANNFANQNNFAFGARTLQFRDDGGLVPGLNLTGTSGNLGILRVRNAIEMWPSDDLTRGAKVDLRNSAGAATISLNGSDGAITAANMPAVAGSQTFRDLRGGALPILIVNGFQNLETVTVNVPASGYLLIMATANVRNHVTPTIGTIEAYLKIEDATGAPVQLTEVGVLYIAPQSGAEYDSDLLTAVWMVPVAAAGQRTYRSVITVVGGAGSPSNVLSIYTTTLHVTYIGRGM